MNKILIFSDWFSPAYKAGGPIQSIANLIKLLKGNFEVYILTSAYDELEDSFLDGIKPNKWLKYLDNVHVYYADKGKNITRVAESIITSENINTIYLNSMFSISFSIKPLFVLWSSSIKIIISPRGMLKSSALGIKPFRKTIYLKFLKFRGLAERVIFIASDNQECKDIERCFGRKSKISQIGNVPYLSEDLSLLEKKKGELKLIFVGRIHPIKNLDFLVNILEDYKEEDVTLDIVGSIGDNEYFRNIKSQINDSVHIKYLGPIPPEQLKGDLKQYHALVLPTKGENFGHAIFEAFASGRPVLISDQTPWRSLKEKGIGFDVSLNDSSDFKIALDYFINMGQEEYNDFCLRALQFGKSYIEEQNFKERYINLFSK